MSDPVSFTGDFKRQFAVLAKKIGSDRELRAMTKTFGFSESFEEILAKVEAKLRGNPAFREKWKAWAFYPVLVSHSVKVNEEGVVLVAKGDQKVIMIR
jgi:hypothetical protein